MNLLFSGILLPVITFVLVGCGGPREHLQENVGESYETMFEGQRAPKSDASPPAERAESGATAELIFKKYQEQFSLGAEGALGDATPKK